MQNAKQKPLLSRAYVREILGISETTEWRWLRDKKIKGAVTIAGRIVGYNPDIIETFITEHTDK